MWKETRVEPPHKTLQRKRKLAAERAERKAKSAKRIPFGGVVQPRGAWLNLAYLTEHRLIP